MPQKQVELVALSGLVALWGHKKWRVLEILFSV